MKLKDIRLQMNTIGTWVDRDKTCDQVLHGDPEKEVHRAAVCWSCTLGQLQEAEGKGCDLFVTHEPLYGYLELRPVRSARGAPQQLALESLTSKE